MGVSLGIVHLHPLLGHVTGLDAAYRAQHIHALKRESLMLADDSIGIHEELGGLLMRWIPIPSPDGLRAKDLAEAVAFAAVEGTALLVVGLVTLVAVPTAFGQAAHPAGGEANLRIPDLGQVHVAGASGRSLLMVGLGVCVLGLVFGLVIYSQLKNLPVHASMREISELIYETCKTYLITQGRFILLLELFIGGIMAFYFYVLQDFELIKVVIILVFSLIGIGGSYGVAWFGIRGIGSLYYVMYAVEKGLPPALADELVSITLTVIALSVLVHGMSVTPLLNYYQRRR